MQLIFLLASLLGVVQASSIGAPAVMQAGSQTVTLQFAIPAGFNVNNTEVSLVFGMVNCPPAGCPAPSVNLGEIVSVTILNTSQPFDNFTLQVPSDITGPASIQIQHNFFTTSSLGTTPTVEYLSSPFQLIGTVTAGLPPASSTAASSSLSSSQQVGMGTATSSLPPASTTPTPAPSIFNLHPNGNNAKCVGIKAGVFADGTPVDIFDCDGTVTQQWQRMGNALTSVDPADGSHWCLDAGDSNLWANGVPMKIWQCFSNLVQQTWAFQTNSNIQLTTANFCLDLTNGVLTNQNVLQIWTCGGENPNQAWTQTSA